MKIPENLRKRVAKTIQDTVSTAKYNAGVAANKFKDSKGGQRILDATKRAYQAVGKGFEKATYARGEDSGTRKFYGQHSDSGKWQGKPEFYEKHKAAHEKDMRTPVSDETKKKVRQLGVKSKARHYVEHGELPPFTYKAGLGWGKIVAPSQVGDPGNLSTLKLKKAKVEYPKVNVRGKQTDIRHAVRSAANDKEAMTYLKPFLDASSERKKRSAEHDAWNLRIEANKLKGKDGKSVSETIAKEANKNSRESRRTTNKIREAIKGKGRSSVLTASQEAEARRLLNTRFPKWGNLTQGGTIPLAQVLNGADAVEYHGNLESIRAEIRERDSKLAKGKLKAAADSGTLPRVLKKAVRRARAEDLQQEIDKLTPRQKRKWLEKQGRGKKLAAGTKDVRGGAQNSYRYGAVKQAIDSMSVPELEKWIAHQTKEIKGAGGPDNLLKHAVSRLSNLKNKNIRNRPKGDVESAKVAHDKADKFYERMGNRNKQGSQKLAGNVIGDTPDEVNPRSDRQTGRSKNRRIEQSAIGRLVELGEKPDKEKRDSRRRLAVGGGVGAALGLKSASNYIGRVRGEHQRNKGWAGIGVPGNDVTSDRPPVYPVMKDYPGRREGAWARGDVPLFSRHAPKGFRGHVAKESLKKIGKLTAAGIIAGGIYDVAKRRIQRRREKNQED
jgi:hypothetical protein